MSKGKNKVTKENIEEYKKLYEARQTLTDQDMKKVLVRMGISLFLGVGMSFLFPPSSVLFSLILALICTYGVVVHAVNGIIKKKEDALFLAHPDLDFSMTNEEIESQMQQVKQQEKRKKECRERKMKRNRSAYSVYVPINGRVEKPKVLVKTLRDEKSVRK